MKGQLIILSAFFFLEQYIKMKRWIFEGTKPTPVMLNRPNLEVKKEEPPIEVDPTAGEFI